MPRKAIKCIVEVDIHVISCPGVFLREYEYVYLHMEMLGLEARTKSVPPMFPLFFHERLKFERTFHDFTDPSLVTAKLKGEHVILELRQHTDYLSDGKVIAHCSSNTHDFLYPAIPSYYGSGREILLYKTTNFKPIRVTGEHVKLEFSTKTTIKEIPVSSADDQQLRDNRGDSAARLSRLRTRSSSRARSASASPLRTPKPPASASESFFITRKDDSALSNRDFSTYVNPKPRRSASLSRRSVSPGRRSVSPGRRSVSPGRRSVSPGRRPGSPSHARKALGDTTVESLPSWKYGQDFPRLTSTTRSRHQRASTAPPPASSTLNRSLRHALDDLDVSSALNRSYVDPVLSYRVRGSPNLRAALKSSDRIQQRVDQVSRRKVHSLESGTESDDSLDVLRESLREERNALNDAIREADREAFYRSVNRSR